jgi:branched-chain amino acid transport system ATP-binding protein
VRAGSVTALIGPNGAGKTTAFNLVTGFIKPDAGEVRFEEERIEGRSPDEIARLGMVRTFQLTRVLAKMTVLENVMLAAPRQPGERFGTALFRPRRWRGREREVRAEALEMLGEVGIHTHANEYAATLSGGQRKLLELARALMTQPRLVLLDEPMAGVNPTLGHRLLDYLARLREERGLTVLFVEHDMDVVMGVSDEVIVMAQGAVIAHGTPQEVRADPAVIDAYLGAEPAAA